MPQSKKPLHNQETPLHFKSGDDYFPARGTIKLEVIVNPLKGTALNHADNGKKGNFRRQDKVFPLEPPPIVKLVPPEHNRLLLNNSPNLFCVATLKSARIGSKSQCSEELEGSRVVSLTKLKRSNIFGTLNLRSLQSKDILTYTDEIGVFVFSSLHVKNVGEYYLDFNLFEMVISGQGMCAMHIATEHSRKFTIYPKAGDLGSPVSEPLVKEMLNQGIKMRIRKVGRPNKKPKQSWECTLDEVRHASGQPLLGSHHAEPTSGEDPDAITVGSARSRSDSSRFSHGYPPPNQPLYNRSMTAVIDQPYMPPPLSTPMYPPARPAINMSTNFAMSTPTNHAGLTATHMDGMAHGQWMPNAYHTSMPPPGPFGSHSLEGQDFNFSQGSNSSMMGYSNTTTHSMAPSSYAIPNHFSQPPLTTPTYVNTGEDHYIPQAGQYGQEFAPFEAGHGNYGNL